MKAKNCRFHSTEDFAAWQRESRRELIELLGITDLLNSERCPLNPRSLWKRENELGTIEKIAFDSEPGVENLVYLCIPHDVKPPYRAFRSFAARSPMPERHSSSIAIRTVPRVSNTGMEHRLCTVPATSIFRVFMRANSGGSAICRRLCSMPAASTRWKFCRIRSMRKRSLRWMENCAFHFSVIWKHSVNR